LQDPTFGGNTVVGGSGTSGGGSGQALSLDLFLMSGGTVVFDITAGTTTFSSVIASNQVASSGGLEKTGAGTLVLSGVNTYTGSTTLSGGVLSVGHDTNLGNSSAGLVFDGGTLHSTALLGVSTNRPVSVLSTGTFSGTGFTLGGLISGAGAITYDSGVFSINDDNNTYQGGTTINTASVLFSHNGALGTGPVIFSGNGSLENTETLTDFNHPITINPGVNAVFNTEPGSLPHALTILSTINGAGGALTKEGLGTLTLTQPNGYDGGTTIQVGTLALAGAGALASTGSVQISTLATFDITGITPLTSTTIGDFTAAAGSFVNLGAHNLTFGTANNTTISALISGSGGSLTKQGSGIATFSGVAPNTYSGGTALVGGTVSIPAQNQLGTGAVTFAGNSTLQFSAPVASFSLPIAINTSIIGIIDTQGFASSISTGITGAGALQKNGSAVLTLTGVNGYTGGTIVNQGTLALSGGGSLSATGSVQINATATFDISAITPASTTIGDLSSAAMGTLALGAKNLTFGTANSTTFSGVINGVGGSLTKQGAGTFDLSLSGPNTYDTGTTLQAGTILIGAANQLGTGALTFSGTSTLQFSAPIVALSLPIQINTGVTGTIDTQGNASSISTAITGSGALKKFGSAVLTLTGANVYSGGTIVSQGTLALATGGSLFSTGSVEIDAGATFDISGITPASTTIGDLSAAAMGTLALGGKNLTFGSSGTTTFAGAITGVGGSLTKQGSGTIHITSGLGLNTYTGGTTLNQGTVSITAPDQLGTGGVTFSGNSTLAFAAAMTFSPPSITINPAVTGIVDTGIHNATIPTGIMGSGALQKNGLGKLTLTGSNSYTGGTIVHGGTLAMSGTGVLDTGSAVQIDAFGIFDIAAITPSSFTIGDLSSSLFGVLELGGKNLIFGTSNSTTFTGAILGAGGSLTKMGSGTFTLNGSAANTYSGGTTLNAGTISVNAGNKLGSGTVTFAGNSTLQFTGSVVSFAPSMTINNLVTGTIDVGPANPLISVTVSNAITGMGALQKEGLGTLSLTQVNSYSGGTTINAGTLALFGNGALLSTGSVTVNSGGTFDISNIGSPSTTIGDLTGAANSNLNLGNRTLIFGTGNSTSFSGVISGNSGVLTKTGAGTFTLNGTSPNTYGGGTTIQGGAIAISSASSLGTGTFTFGANSTLQFLNAFTLAVPFSFSGAFIGTIDTGANNDTLSGALSGTGSLQKIGSGTLTLSNASNNYSGGTTISVGTLALTGSGSLPPTGLVQISAGATLDISQITSSTTLGDLSAAATGTLALGTKNLTFGTSNSTTFSGSITGTGGGSLTKQGSGSFDLTGSGSNTYDGGTTLQNGTVLISAQDQIGTGGVTFSGNGTLQFGASITPFSLPIAFNTGATGTIDIQGNASTINTAMTGGGAFQKKGAATLTLTGASTFTGGTTINQGTLALSLSGSLASSGSVQIDAGATLDISGITPASASIGNLSAAPTGTLALGSKNLIIGTSATNTFSGIITGVGGSLTKQGMGTFDLSLSGPNTYSGGTTIQGGTITISAQNQLGTGAVTFSGNSTLQFSAPIVPFSLPIAINASVVGTIDTQGNASTISTAITGGGALEKQGSAVLTLTGANMYSGGTIVNQGTLALSLGGSFLSTGSVEIDTGATFDISGITPASATIGDLTGIGSATLNLGGKNLIFGTANNTSFSGLISGALGSLTKQGSGTFTVTGANTYSGGTTLDAGTFSISNDNSLGTGTLHFNGGELAVTQSTTSSRTFDFLGNGTVHVSLLQNLQLNGAMTGAGNLNKTGDGKFTIAGNNALYSGSVDVTTGALHVNSALLVPVAVHPFGLLGGNGSVGTVTNDGFVSPGNSIDTLTVMGNYTQSATGSLVIEINDQGQSDRLDITGTASLDGFLEVIPLNGSYFANSHTYLALEAVGGRSGTFPHVLVLDPSLQLKINVVYTATQVLLQIGSNSLFVGPVLTEHNPQQVARYLESLQYFQNGTIIPSQRDLVDVILSISRLDSNGVQKALDQLHPAQYGEFGLINSDVRSYIASFLNRHPEEECCKHLVEACFAGGATVWMDPFGLNIDQDAVHDQRGFHASIGGVVIGGDYCFKNNLLIGLAVGGNVSHLHWSGSMGDGNFPSGFTALYADWAKKYGYVEASVLAGLDFYHLKRHIHFPGVHRNAKSSHKGYDLNAHLGGGLDLNLGGVYLQPFFNLDYSFLHQNAFKEHGAKSLNLSVSEKSFGFLRAEEGLALTKSFKGRRGCWYPKIWASLVTSVPMYYINYISAMQSQDKTFKVWTYDRTVNRFSPGAEITFDFKGLAMMSLRYGAEIGSHSFEQKADVRLEWGF
jgi:autotransporter-associated beta strand protein